MFDDEDKDRFAEIQEQLRNELNDFDPQKVVLDMATKYMADMFLSFKRQGLDNEEAGALVMAMLKATGGPGPKAEDGDS